MDQTRVDAEGLVEELLASTDLKPVELDECKLYTYPNKPFNLFALYDDSC